MGPLAGIRIVELGGIGPGPFTSMLFSEMGADALRISRPAATAPGIKGFDKRHQLLNRGRRTVAMDLKNPRAIEAVKRLVSKADALTEGFRPGVAERLGLGPEDCLRLNPKLVYGRITGWGQDGPLANAPGHDINYIALTGALHAIGSKGGPPVPPLNLVGDFGGGAMYLAFGMVCAILEARSSGQRPGGRRRDDRRCVEPHDDDVRHACRRLVDRQSWLEPARFGTPWYDVYETSDGKWISVGCNEPQFYDALLERLGGIAPGVLPADRHDRNGWPAIRACFTQKFRAKTRDEWCAIMDGTRGLLRARALDGRGAAASAHEGARHLHRAGRRGPAGTRAALRPHQAGNPAAGRDRSTSTPTKRFMTGVSARTKLPSCAPAAPSADVKRTQRKA